MHEQAAEMLIELMNGVRNLLLVTGYLLLEGGSSFCLCLNPAVL